jgi:hypothetical protein
VFLSIPTDDIVLLCINFVFHLWKEYRKNDLLTFINYAIWLHHYHCSSVAEINVFTNYSFLNYFMNIKGIDQQDLVGVGSGISQ